jgi:hypothetical protein
MELSSITNQIKVLLSYGYIGYCNYVHIKNFNTESWDIKDRLNSYNMKYPITINFNKFFLKDLRILYYALIINFIFIFSAAFFKIKNFGYLILISFVLNEFYFYNDNIMIIFYDFDYLSKDNIFELIKRIPIDIAHLITLIFGILFVTSNIPNKKITPNNKSK